jgi:aspartate kinase
MSPEQQEANPAADGDLARHKRGGGLPKEVVYSSATPPRDKVTAFKFGGSSLLGAERMLHAASLVQATAQHASVTVVVSAMACATRDPSSSSSFKSRRVLKCKSTMASASLPARSNSPSDCSFAIPRRRSVTPSVNMNTSQYDHLTSFGERFSARLFAGALVKIGMPAVPVASSDFVLTCDTFQDASPQLEHTRQRGQEVLLPLLEEGLVPVVTGFIGATRDGRITTLGRNSSDFSGAIIAHVVDADELVIWTDVGGIYTANPKEAVEAKLLHEISYDEAHALAASGAKVLHPHGLPLAAQTEMTVWVRNTFKPHARGTRIGPSQNLLPQNGGVA